MEDTKQDMNDDQQENENQNALNSEELDLLAFLLNQQERPLHSGL
jgi:hypothetical protein